MLTLVDALFCGLYVRAVRFLLADNHGTDDATAGMTQSLRTIMTWLADAGHACRMVATQRFESRITIWSSGAAQGLVDLRAVGLDEPFG
jgi:hypothetical protein